MQLKAETQTYNMLESYNAMLVNCCAILSDVHMKYLHWSEAGVVKTTTEGHCHVES